MKSKLQKQLAEIAPSIFIETTWEHDEDEYWEDPLNKDWTEGEDPEDWQAWQSEIKAVAVHQGDLVVGSGYLGGSWFKIGEILDPEINGYESQKTEEALRELSIQLNGGSDQAIELQKQITNAIKACR